MKTDEEVIILISTYNGEKYIQALLDSLYTQTYKNISIILRDDGSTDSTLDIVRKNSNISYETGNNIGYIKSFLQLIYNAPSADFYMLCDQDDIWLPDKVERAVCAIREKEGPAIYTSNVLLCDEKLRTQRRTSFVGCANIWQAFLYNNAVGCTMAFNKKLRERLTSISIKELNIGKVFSHDAWIHRVCFAIGGEGVFDENAYVLYRQHENNAIGCGSNQLDVWLRRLRKIKDRGIKKRLAQEIEERFGEAITRNAKSVIHQIAHYNDWSTIVKILKNRDIYTGNHALNIALAASFVFRLI